MKRIAALITVCMLAGLFTGCGAQDPSPGAKPASAAKAGTLIVGTDIALDDITEFYDTYASSTFPPEYQRYRFYVEAGRYMFYHEQREGDHFPLTEEDITVSGSKELTKEEKETFFGFLKDGTVTERQESLDAGDSGPWRYLYWDGDEDRYQEFSFETWDKAGSFEDFCIQLKNTQLKGN